MRGSFKLRGVGRGGAIKALYQMDAAELEAQLAFWSSREDNASVLMVGRVREALTARLENDKRLGFNSEVLR
jgi:hypothetical protein